MRNEESSKNHLEIYNRLRFAIGDVVISFQQIELWVAECLAGLFDLKVLEDRYLISSAMSYRQKVDLLCELFPRKKTHLFGVEMRTVKKALYVAEEYRNRIVHSVWAINGEEGWTRNKSSLRGRNGFSIVAERVDVEMMEDAVKALMCIRNWETVDTKELEQATQVLSTNTQTA